MEVCLTSWKVGWGLMFVRGDEGGRNKKGDQRVEGSGRGAKKELHH